MRKPKHPLTGKRVALHPGMDAWMRGDRYGTVRTVTAKYVYVWTDRSQQLRRIPISRIDELQTVTP